MMHLIVQDGKLVGAAAAGETSRPAHGRAQTAAPQDRPWRQRDLVLCDPSGVLWLVAQYTA